MGIRCESFEEKRKQEMGNLDLRFLNRSLQVERVYANSHLNHDFCNSLPPLSRIGHMRSSTRLKCSDTNMPVLNLTSYLVLLSVLSLRDGMLHLAPQLALNQY